ncbi:hypothetical protein OQA88_8168 [Cercophora sp. LCS_1]
MKSLLASAVLASAVSATIKRHRGVEIGPFDEMTARLSKRSEQFNGWGAFDQLLDHSDPSLGTFKQRYWYGTEFWRGPGSPIILTTPGEQSAEGFNKTYTTTQRLTGLFAKELGGAVVVLEHRYWGESSPFQELTVKNLQYLTLENSIKDLSYFARNFALPSDTSGKSSPNEAPWVYSGGSYAGALAGWSAALDPGTIWAYHGTSGVVESVGDFWEYFTPVLEATPQNCSKDVQAVIDHVDRVLSHGSRKDKMRLKNRFMLTSLSDVDFASFCDYIENMWPGYSEKAPGPQGVGVQKALEGYAKWFTEQMLPGFCEPAGYPEWKGTYNAGCLQQSNGSSIMYHDLRPDNWINRQWNWMLCNEPFEFWQTASPRGRSSLVSRLVTADYWRRQCGFHFPPEKDGDKLYTYNLAEGERARDVNAFTGGWFATNTTRLMQANGALDPWRESTVAAKSRPDGPAHSTEQHPLRIIPGGTHCSDLYAQNWAVNEDLEKIVDEQVKNMRKWVDEFYEINNKPRAR